MQESLVKLTDVTFNYGNSSVLKDITLSVKPGEFWALIGPNGSGKSTLIKILLGLLKPNKGSVELFGEPISSVSHKERIGYVSQKSNSFNSGFPATVLEVVRSGLTKKTGLLKRFSKADTEAAMNALLEVDMREFADRNIGELSGGQQQRVFIARALAAKPELLIMDEPTVGVDQQNSASFYSMLEKLNRDNGIAIILVSHEIDLVTDLASHVACLNRTMHFHGGRRDFAKLNDNDLSRWYGHSVRLVHQKEGDTSND
ncbi:MULTISPECIES: metal ABC transporter ATP-binding protein [unclassified Sporosarcina]|uniref:metal ABC transporter ATP-binding protein n=1 Tax=unclassified Sporosarcina TaxID=2647733 RepID=UPI00057A6BF4|nr:metal ABC transporter ATP-binding protein [Sporosarcina sp. ZBG7A]VDH01457.1 Zinc import ATP-binding protein ZnuC [Lysinibacillus sphaericus]